MSQESDSTVSDDGCVGSPAERVCYHYGIAPKGDHLNLLYRYNFTADPCVPPTNRYANLATKSVRSARGTRLATVWGNVLFPIDALVFVAIRKSYSNDPVRFFTVPGVPPPRCG